jgi:hypothetical protein
VRAAARRPRQRPAICGGTLDRESTLDRGQPGRARVTSRSATRPTSPSSRPGRRPTTRRHARHALGAAIRATRTPRPACGSGRTDRGPVRRGRSWPRTTTSTPRRRGRCRRRRRPAAIPTSTRARRGPPRRRRAGAADHAVRWRRPGAFDAPTRLTTLDEQLLRARAAIRPVPRSDPTPPRTRPAVVAAIAREDRATPAAASRTSPTTARPRSRTSTRWRRRPRLSAQLVLRRTSTTIPRSLEVDESAYDDIELDQGHIPTSPTSGRPRRLPVERKTTAHVVRAWTLLRPSRHRSPGRLRIDRGRRRTIGPTASGDRRGRPAPGRRGRLLRRRRRGPSGPASRCRTLIEPDRRRSRSTTSRRPTRTSCSRRAPGARRRAPADLPDRADPSVSPSAVASCRRARAAARGSPS